MSLSLSDILFNRNIGIKLSFNDKLNIIIRRLILKLENYTIKRSDI
jgi:hypothetical protein